MTKKKALMIVDPQIDFIDGTLPVPGAVAAMDALAKYIRKNGYRYSLVIVTLDGHPSNHCSFKQFGGQWPRHCVADSVGAAVWPPINEALYDFNGDVYYMHKAENKDVEEYSIFSNKQNARYIESLIKNGGIEQIDICGLAGDVCVAATLRDGIACLGRSLFNVLTEFTPSIGSGRTLRKLIVENGLMCDGKAAS